MFRWLAELYVKNCISRDNATRNRQFLSWDRIEKIALILDQADHINKSEVDKFVSDTRKYVDVFYVELGSGKPTFGDWRCFPRKDRSLLHLPKAAVRDEVRKKNFDLVINTSGDRLFSAALTAAISAPFKCGNGMTAGTDLIIARDEKTPLLNHLNDVVTYLKMIRTR